MKKRIVMIVLVVLLVLTLIPVRVFRKDGGSNGWCAIFWQFMDYHEMRDVNGEYLVGKRVTILGFISIYDDTHVAYLNE